MINVDKKKLGRARVKPKNPPKPEKKEPVVQRVDTDQLRAAVQEGFRQIPDKGKADQLRVVVQEGFKQISEKIEKQKKRSFRFDINRDRTGLITTVDVTEK